ncbi:hypothetical protein K2173_001484 [Erythroxylum novogranatense]|uniref:Uncharacterized protein n=1 Tax=Erythroxylum novogranatense TaxID=1862640 RepID=A0AAV8UBB1_9ROSI|nr:hypothetical protein K2173_001484 [Erythroxylum novogranatense]
MEALWKLEDKWKLKTRDALLLFVCSAIAVVCLCTATILKRKDRNKDMVNQDPDGNALIKCSPCGSNRVTIRRVLMGSFRWSGPSKWYDENAATLGETPQPQVSRWQSQNSLSPVWQRPILMGEKCELPRFSGLILYDERGRLLDHSLRSSSNNQEKQAVLRTSLKDLL